VSPLIDINVNIDVFVYNGPATVGGKCLVGDLGWGGFMEQLGGSTARGSLETLIFVESLSLHDSGTSACAVFMEIDVTMAAREAVVLLEAEVLIAVTTTTTSI
jgi:hypothetical protein